MKAMSFNNVKLSRDVETYVQAHGVDKSMISAHPMLEPVIAKLAMLYPLWTFKGDGHTSLNYHPVLTSFALYCDDEHLGNITRRYEGHDYQICVENDRIKASLERGRYYKTKSADKAVAKVKKMFSPRSTGEVLDLARDHAASVAQTAEWNKTREKDDAHEIVKRAAIKYVMGAGFKSFMDHVKDHLPAQEHDLLVAKREVSDKATEDLVTISAVRSAIANRKLGAVITRRGATYVMDHDDKVEICDDNTLPEWIRNRIGMLKLVEPDQFVSGLGMRASANTFVIIKPKEENLTIVTEGETK